jgi:hypothetical protein
VNAGFVLQLDCPDIPMIAHTRGWHDGKKIYGVKGHAELHIQAINRAIKGLPPGMIRLHICWGNYSGPHHHDVALSEILEPRALSHGLVGDQRAASRQSRDRLTQHRVRSVWSLRRAAPFCGLSSFPPIRTGAARVTCRGLSHRSAPVAGHGDPMMHITSTVDYIIVLEGEIYAVMDKGETLLKQGDVLVQRGTNHSWHNRSDQPCIIAAVLVSADPVQ